MVLAGCDKQEPTQSLYSAHTKKPEEMLLNPIEAAMRRELRKPIGEPTQMELDQVTKLYLVNKQLTDVSNLARFKSLRGVNLDGNKLTSVRTLAELTKLENLSLADNLLTNVNGLEGLTQLLELNLVSNELTDQTPLTKLVLLKELLLYNNPNLTKIEITRLQKALPKCKIHHNAAK